MKKIFSLVLGLLVISGLFSPIAFSQTPTPSSTEIDSFKLFWPLSAGKVEGEKFYSLKLLKENARGAVIFGKPQKAEYKMFLATKRFIEVEKLIKEKKNDNAKKTIANGNKNLEEANQLLMSLKDKSMPKTADEINLKITNLKMFIPYLEKISEGALKEDLTKSSQLLEELSKNI